MHFERSELVGHLRFRPNVEVGVGDNVTLVHRQDHGNRYGAD